mmetsp:Transcript_17028/g.30857  ORF Transcript_17028/g.30857 Transcript_17028/m.30857 type:complete len:111 (-) Transcript_17028:108-440(-)
MTVEFVAGGTGDLYFHFDFPPELEEKVRRELETKGYSTPSFECGYFLKDGTQTTKITNVVAIRPKGYIKASAPPASDEFHASRLTKLEESLKERLEKEHEKGGDSKGGGG